MEVSAAATIAGEGEIGFAKINENGVKTIKPTAPIEKGKDVDQVEIVDPSPSPRPRPSGGGQSSGPSGIAVNTITLKAEKILLVAGGDTKTIEATIMPSNATNKTLTWTSTNENVAKVIDGVVTSLEAGEAIIEAKAGGKSARVSVVVKAATPEEDFEFDSDTRTITAYNNWGLQEVVIPDSVETIKKRAFYDNKLSSVEIGNSVKTIGEAAFRENELTSLVIPDSVETIGERAFSKNALISITIPSSVTSMGPGVFNNNQLPVDQAFIYAMNLDGTQDKTRLISYGGKERDEVVIPDNVTTIGEIAFEYSELKSVVIPNSVVSIGSSAFRFNDLISVVISNSMADIGEYAFYGNFLTSLDIPGSVEIIGECAFYKNTLISVTIPSSVTNMGEGVFLSNGPDKNSENIPESDFVGTWRIVGTKWIRDTPLIKYAVTYDLNAGTGTVPIQADVAENVIFTVADPADLTGPEGKVFKEWNTLADGTGTAYAAGDTITMGLEAVTLYAIWEDIT